MSLECFKPFTTYFLRPNIIAKKFHGADRRTECLVQGEQWFRTTDPMMFITNTTHSHLELHPRVQEGCTHTYTNL